MSRKNETGFFEESISPVDVLARKQDKAVKRHGWISLIAELLLTGISVFLLFGVIFGLGRVDGGSMYPVLEDGDLFLYYRLNKNYVAGDIVVFEYAKGDPRVKRVVGVTGDLLEIDALGTLLVNGAPSKVEVFYETDPIPGGLAFPYSVQEGELVLMGDHRETSIDSRETGAIPLSKIKGKVIYLVRNSF